MPFNKRIGNRKPMGYFSWFLMVFITLKKVVLKKIGEIFNFAVFVFLSICYQALLWTGPVSFLVN